MLCTVCFICLNLYMFCPIELAIKCYTNYVHVVFCFYFGSRLYTPKYKKNNARAWCWELTANKSTFLYRRISSWFDKWSKSAPEGNPLNYRIWENFNLSNLKQSNSINTFKLSKNRAMLRNMTHSHRQARIKLSRLGVSIQIRTNLILSLSSDYGPIWFGSWNMNEDFSFLLNYFKVWH